MTPQLSHTFADIAKKAAQGVGGDMANAYHGILKDTESGATKVAENTAKKEAETAKPFDAMKKPEGEVPKPAPPKPGPPKPAPPKPGPSRPNAWDKPLPKPTPPPGPKLRDDVKDPKKPAVQTKTRTTRSDPVDVASGDMVLSATDVALPGTLPLVLSRTHLSSYRAGGWFGRSWASTLDQKLELDDDGVVFAAEDGMMLSYPVPSPGAVVQPVEGPRWPLRWDGAADGALVVTDPHSGTSWHFAPVAGYKSTRALQLPLTAISDRNGNRIEIDHDAQGAPCEVRHSGGYRVGVTASAGRITGLRLLPADGPAVELVAFGYDGNGNLDAVTDSSGLPFRYTYDESARITGWTNRAGHRYRYLYDRAGRCVQTRGDGGFLDGVFSYDDEHRVTRVTDALGQVSVLQFDEYGRPLSETAPTGAVATTSWDRHGRLLQRTDPLGATTAFDYDADGNLSRTTLPDGTVSTAAYDDRHRLVELTALDGTQWSYGYDEHGNLAERTDPLGARTGYAHGPHGEPRSVTDPLGARTEVSTDPAGLVTEIVDPLGAHTRCVRDAFGRVVELTDPLGRTVRYGWTVEGRIAWEEGPDGARQEWRHDPDGNLVAHRDAAGAQTAYEYTYFGRLAARIEPDGSRYAFEYDGQLQLTAVTNPAGERWTYRYDEVGALVEETDFAGRTVSYTRDLTGQLTGLTNGAGQTTSYLRDTRGRTTEVTVGEQTTRFAYDPAGRLLEAAVTGGAEPTVLRYRYDLTGRQLGEECDGFEVASEYDPTGRRVLRRTPSGVESRWSYDAAGRPTELLSGRAGESAPLGALRMEYDAAGREQARRFGDSVLRQGWDPMDRLAGLSLTAADGRAVIDRGFGHRADGAPVELRDAAHGVLTYQLDARARVTGVTGATWSERYAYDRLGNVDTTPDAPAEFDAGGRLRADRRTSYDYDEQGRVVRQVRRLLSGGRQTWEYRWDGHDQLTGLTTPDGTVWRYHYDPLGRRIAKQRLAADGRTVAEQTRFSWDGAHLVEQHRTGAEVTTTSWDWSVGGQVPLTQVTRATDLSQQEVDRRFHAIVSDLSGAPTELVDPTGAVAWQRRAGLWGQDADSPQEQAADCPLRFPGQYLDRESGLHYNVLRYFDPGTARYLSPDPMGLAPADNPYGYVPNPMTGMDPLGLDPTMLDFYHGTTKPGADAIIDKGINPAFKPRPMDFGHGGFYVTNDARQAAQWARIIGERRGEAPAVLHFRVPKDELDALNGKRFGPGEDQALEQFIRKHRADRNGSQMHNYDFVEGKMLRNMESLRNRQVPMTLNGHQLAVHGQGAVNLFDKSRVE